MCIEFSLCGVYYFIYTNVVFICVAFSKVFMLFHKGANSFRYFVFCLVNNKSLLIDNFVLLLRPDLYEFEA